MSRHRKLFEDIARQLELNRWEDWYTVPTSKINATDVGRVLKYHYGGSKPKALEAIFPEYKWKLWKFSLERIPPSFWTSKSNRREFMDDLVTELNLQSPNDYYQIKNEHVVERGGTALLKIFDNSTAKLLMNVYPEHDFPLWRFERFGNNNLEFARSIMDEVKRRLHISSQSEWYRASYQDIMSNGGSRVLSMFEDSHTDAIIQLYPEYYWRRWNFSFVPQDFWDDFTHQLQFLNDLYTRLNLQHFEDWYQLSEERISNLGGSGLLKCYNGSLFDMFSAVFPEHDFKEFRFRVKAGYWDDLKNQLKFLEYAAKKLGIERDEDWAVVSKQQLASLGGGGLIKKGGLADILSRHFPGRAWHELLDDNQSKAAEGASTMHTKGQRLLFKKVTELFPVEHPNIFMSYVHPSLRFSESSKPVELDVFIPSLGIAFEYQGGQHYFSTSKHMDIDVRKLMDEEKKRLCKENGITLVDVPFWWDGSADSLTATIRSVRPELFPIMAVDAAPIPERPHQKLRII
eukprot:TRINITY_DN6892_c0_g1_i1.p1 TRINITY_DN6892_c0_g1~~TRINITY_DN6892_c0_g1_i1.p1  ORF type:complete len:515 (+),score=94.07 TRINITY_DN6892_c0_g1_i1:59-1603(+)